MRNFLNKGVSTTLGLIIVIGVAALATCGIFTYQKWWISEGEMENVLQTIDNPPKAENFWDSLKNAEYYSIFLNKNIKLIDGLYSELPEPGTASHCEVQYDNNSVDWMSVGDLNDDGILDSPVILISNCGGSGSFRELAIIINKNEKPKYLTSRMLGDRVIVNSISIDAGIITLRMVIQGSGDGMCCPTLNKILKLEIINNQLVEI